MGSIPHKGVPHSLGLWITDMVILVLYSIFAAVNFFLLYRFRNHWYLRARSVVLLAVVQLALLLGYVAMCLQTIIGAELVPCYLILGVGILGTPMLLGTHLIRIVRLILVFKANKFKISVALDEHNSELYSAKLHRRTQLLSKLASDRSMVLFYMIVIALHLPLYLVVIAAIPSARTHGRCTNNLAVFVTGPILVMHMIIEAVLVTLLIRDVREEYNIAKRIYVSVVIGIVVCFLYVLTTLLPQYTQYVHQRYFYMNYWLMMGSFLDTINIIVVPIVQCKFFKKQRFAQDEESNTPLLMNELQATLETKALSETFEKYCKLEFSTENYYFYRHISELMQQRRPVKREVLLRIMTKYVFNDAPLGLNVSAAGKRDSSTLFEALTDDVIPPDTVVEMFGHLQQEVKSNLLDTFTRFKVSKLYKLHQEHVEAERKLLADAGLQ